MVAKFLISAEDINYLIMSKICREHAVHFSTADVHLQAAQNDGTVIQDAKISADVTITLTGQNTNEINS